MAFKIDRPVPRPEMKGGRGTFVQRQRPDGLKQPTLMKRPTAPKPIPPKPGRVAK